MEKLTRTYTGDGVREVFVVENVEVEARQVAWAAVLADAFARGCETAVAMYRSSEIDFERPLPDTADLGRLAPWRRAEAFFGTNGIRIVRANFNSKTAEIVCAHLNIEDVNPCFQALVCCYRLLPYVNEFKIYRHDQRDPCIVVSKTALERTFQVWTLAAQNFTSMPFTTFLPANLDSRRRLERQDVAVRSVAWIATDDFLDALDGAPDWLAGEELQLFSKRLSLVSTALEMCISMVPEPAVQLRLRAVGSCVAEVRAWLDCLPPLVAQSAISALEPALRIRFWWKRWGPVERIPGVGHTSPEHLRDLHKPQLREESGDLRWRTI